MFARRRHLKLDNFQRNTFPFKKPTAGEVAEAARQLRATSQKPQCTRVLVCRCSAHAWLASCRVLHDIEAARGGYVTESDEGLMRRQL